MAEKMPENQIVLMKAGSDAVTVRPLPPPVAKVGTLLAGVVLSGVSKGHISHA